MPTQRAELAKRGYKLPNSSNYDPAKTEPQSQAAALEQLLIPVDLPSVAPMQALRERQPAGVMQGVSPCALGLCDEQTITSTAGPTIGGGVWASPVTTGALSPELIAWNRRAAERVFGGRSISVPAAASEVAAGQVLGLMDDPAYQQRTSQLAPLLGLPAAAAQARSDVANVLGLSSDYMASPAFGADQRLLETAQQQAQARAAATGVYDQLGVWNDVRPNAQALNPTVTPQGVGVAIQNAQGGIDVVPTNRLAGVVATPASVQRDALAQQAQAAQAQRDAARQQAALTVARLRLAEARRAVALRLQGQQAVQTQRDTAAAQRQEDKLKSKGSSTRAASAPKL